jgi:hypothetical protein
VSWWTLVAGELAAAAGPTDSSRDATCLRAHRETTTQSAWRAGACGRFVWWWVAHADVFRERAPLIEWELRLVDGGRS